MKLPRLVLAAALFAGVAAFAQDAKKTTPPSASADAKAAYPLTTCVVSGENLEEGDMGGPVDYIYKVAGKPDRLVRFCCKMCVPKFEKDPAKYLKKLDDAAAAQAKAAAAPKS